MSGHWKAFWLAIGAGLLWLAGFLLGRRKEVMDGGDKPANPESPVQIAQNAQTQIDKMSAEIKAASDAALAARFNRLAKKKEDKE